MALAGITAAAIPAGWIALRHVPVQGKQSGYWILIKEPADGLAAWWSDEELAKIIAGDEDYVQHLETGWSPDDHPVASATEATQLAEELAKYWEGDLPQANYWAHGALTRRGDTPQAFRWEQDGLAQRATLEQSGKRPEIPAAALDPDPVDQRYDNRADIVAYGVRWGSHLRTGTLDHVYRAELNKAKRRHHPNPPSAGEVEQKARETVRACRKASRDAEMGVFENYVRGWGGLGAKSVTFGMPANCVADPGPLLAQAPPPSAPPATYTACDGSKHSSQAAANAVNCAPQPPPARRPSAPPATYTACDGSKHSSQAAANAVNCAPPPPPARRPSAPSATYTACDGSKHASRAAANAVNCAPPPPPSTNKPTPGCTIAWLCGSDPDPDRDPDGGENGGSGGENGGGGGGDPPTDDYEACDGSMHSTQSAADAVTCDQPPPVVRYQDCHGNYHDTQSAADAVSCETTYTACDGSTHSTQQAADAVDCSQKFREQILHDLTCEGTVDQTTGQCDDFIFIP